MRDASPIPAASSLTEVEALRARLEEAEATLEAIRAGAVDALVVSGPSGEQLYTLQSAAEPYRVLIEQMNQGAATLSAEGVVLYCNRAFAETLRAPLEKIVGSNFATRVLPEHRGRMEQLLQLAEAERAVDELHLAAEPEPIILRVAVSRLSGVAAGNLCLVATDLAADRKRALALQNMMDDLLRSQKALVTSNDSLQREVGERHQAEQEVRDLNATLELRVRERTAELATVNRELEAFASSVSHDLRAPLRAIDGFSRIVLRDELPALSERGRENLQRVRAATQRMAGLIDDLLRLSRTARTGFRRVPLDLAALAREIATELAVAEPGRRVIWHIAPALTARADPGLIRAVLENLLGNAWKFTSHRPEAAIEFARLGSLAEDAFYVRDNGAGFDPRYADKLFGAFQRLHAAEEFPGTGIGLATVQRIIQRHGGRVWAEGAVEAGATFYFTLPDQPRELTRE